MNNHNLFYEIDYELSVYSLARDQSWSLTSVLRARYVKFTQICCHFAKQIFKIFLENKFDSVLGLFYASEKWRHQ